MNTYEPDYKAIARNRWQTALEIQYACNPSGVSKTIHDVCCSLIRTTRMGTDQIRKDPAVRLMVQKLADLCNADSMPFTEYAHLSEICRKHSIPLVKLTREQRKALGQLWVRQQSNDGPPYYATYRQLRRAVQPGSDCVMVPWGGMVLGIEKDGYTHS